MVNGVMVGCGYKIGYFASYIQSNKQNWGIT